MHFWWVLDEDKARNKGDVNHEVECLIQATKIWMTPLPVKEDKLG